MGWMWADEIGIEWLFATQKHTHNSGKSGTGGGKMRKDAGCFPRKTDKRVKVRAKSKSAYWEKEEVGNVSQRKLGSRMGGST